MSILQDWQSKQNPTQPAEHQLIRMEQIEAVRQSLIEMDEKLQVTLILKYFESLTAPQIGEILELKPSTVRSRLREGRLWLAKRMKSQAMEF